MTIRSSCKTIDASARLIQPREGLDRDGHAKAKRGY